MIEELSTRDVSSPDRLSFWNALASRMVAPSLRIEAPEPERFEARLYRRQVGAFEILSPVSAPARIVNGRGSGSEVLNLQMQLIGTTTNFTSGRTSRCEEGDFVLYDPSQPLDLSFTELTQTVILRLPVVLIERHVPRLRELVGIRVRGDCGPGAVFSAFLRNAWQQMQTDDGDWVDTLNEVIWPLLDMAYAGIGGEAAPEDRMAGRRSEVFDIVARELCDPTLNARRIASVMGVSTRYVQMIFAGMATTPSTYIQHRRLDLAAQRLAHEGRHSLITDVAFDCGFSDLSSFCRAFRRRYAVTPSDYRAGVRMAGTTSPTIQ